ncbi:hypothetical protein LCGC14_1467460, partial [marine sediment metagenome]
MLAAGNIDTQNSAKPLRTASLRPNRFLPTNYGCQGFFMCISGFRGILDHGKRTLTWVADRGLYGLDTLCRIVDGVEDHFITWEKNYKQDGWDEKAQEQQFKYLRPRNNAEDLLCFRFRWQEHPWPREPRFRRLIVRAANPGRREIEVSILTSDPDRDGASVIKVIFNRW